MYLQALLSQALKTLGHPTEAEHSIPLRVRDGRALACDRARARVRNGRDETKKPFVEVSGRKGLGVRSTTCSIS